MATLYDQDEHIAEIYDTTETQTDDIALVRRLIGERGGLRIREPFCGTGRILIPLASDGHTVVGTDLSPNMIARATEKVGALPPDVRGRIVLKTENALGNPWGTGFDLVILGANCLHELSSAADQAECIRRAAEALSDGGFLFVDNDARHGDVSERDIGQRTTFPTGRCQDGFFLEGFGEIVRIDRKRNLWHKRRGLRVIDPAGQVHYEEWETCTRPVSEDEVRGWLLANSFSIVELFGNRTGAPFTDRSRRAIFWAQKR
jgi:SAM-dependent methyltransferase